MYVARKRGELRDSMNNTNHSTRITIITPTYNASRWITDLALSIQRQTRIDWEWIVMDDSSTDNTLALLHSLAKNEPRLRVFVKENGGPSDARNHAYTHSNPESQYVVFIDQDDIWEPDALERLIGALEAKPDCVAAQGIARYINSAGEFHRPGFLEDHQRARWGVENGKAVLWPADRPTTFAVEALTERIITAGTVLIRRDALDRAAQLCEHHTPFNAEIWFWEDWDLWLRLTRLGPIAFYDYPVLRYREHDSNLSKTRKLARENDAVRARMIASLPKDSEEYRIALLGRRFHHLMVAQKRLGWIGEHLRHLKLHHAVAELVRMGGDATRAYGK
jgi:glycosyltransferase involved in cell wall biosynthesis